MQEDIERRTVALMVKAPHLTAQLLARVLGAMARKIQRDMQARKTPQGRQSVAKLMNHPGPKHSMPLDGETQLFDQIAKGFKVDYGFHPKGPGRYLLFFKAGQADAIAACFSEYTKRVMTLEKEQEQGQPSIKKQLEQFRDVAQSRPLERERIREAVRDAHSR